jgi:hypothetical protein
MPVVVVTINSTDHNHRSAEGKRKSAHDGPATVYAILKFPRTLLLFSNGLNSNKDFISLYYAFFGKKTMQER